MKQPCSETRRCVICNEAEGIVIRVALGVEVHAIWCLRRWTDAGFRQRVRWGAGAIERQAA
ncbi:MAG: hypothetical protein ACREMB_14405 [Candidatus Rokuibacteriota bacterium]